MPDAEHAAAPPPPSAHGAQPAGRATSPPSRPRRITPTQGRRRRRNSRAHLKAAGSPRPGRTTPNTPQRAADRERSPSGHNRDEDFFDAFMESRMSDPHADPPPAAQHIRPEPRRDYAKGTPLTASRQAHLQRNYTVLGKTPACYRRG